MQNTKDSFFSMDRLVEFGMGMAMSQQITQTMNAMMASMRQPPQVQVAAQPLYVQQPVQPNTPVQAVYRQYAETPQRWQPAPQQVAQHPAAASQAVPQSTATPAAPPVPQSVQPEPILPPLPEVFYISREGRKAEGPYSGTEIARLVAERQVTAQTPVWKTGMAEWKTAADFPDLLTIIALVPPELTKTNTEKNK